MISFSFDLSLSVEFLSLFLANPTVGFALFEMQ